MEKVYHGHDAEIFRISPRVYYRKGNLDVRWQCNSVLLVGEHSVTLVDPTSMEGADEIRQEAAELFNKPVRNVIITHFHSDHSDGLPAVCAEPVTVYCSHECMDELAVPGSPANFVGVFGKTGLLLDGIPVELMTTFGTAHTPWDMLAGLPQDRILCSGDFIVPCSRLQFIYANPEHWLKELRRFAKQEALYDLILPGHDDPLPASHMAELADYMALLLGEAKKCLDKHFPGKPGTVDDVPRSELDRLAAEYHAANSPESAIIRQKSAQRAEMHIRMVTRFLYYRKLM